MEAIHHNPLMNPSLILSADDEMMDSDYENRIQQDEDYDIDLDGGDAYSNTGMDEEMKFDAADDTAYDNDDLMLDEVDYQTANTIQEEEFILLDAQQPEGVNVGGYKINNTYESKDLSSIQNNSVPITSTESADVQPAVDISVNMSSDPAASAQYQEYGIVDLQNSVIEAVPEEQQSSVGGTQQTELDNEPQEQKQQLSRSPKGHFEEIAEETVEKEKGNDFSHEAPQGNVEQENKEIGKSEGTVNNEHSFQAEIPKLHPVIVQFEGNTLSLFNSEFYIDSFSKATGQPEISSTDAYPEIPTVYLLNDASLATKGFDELFTALRELFADEIYEDAELTTEIHELELFLHEDNLLTKSISLSDLIDLYMRLCHQDGIENPHPIYITLATQLRFTKRYSELLRAAGEGKGISQVRTYGSLEELEATGSVHDPVEPHSAKGSPLEKLEDEGISTLNPQGEAAENSQPIDQMARETSPTDNDNEIVLVAKEPSEQQEGTEANEDGDDFSEEIYPNELLGNDVADLPQNPPQNPDTEVLASKTSSEPLNSVAASEPVENTVETKRKIVSEVTVEEITDDNALEALTAEEIDEPEESVATETQSVTEVTVETANGEEELLDYEEENEADHEDDYPVTGPSSPNLHNISNEEIADEIIVRNQPTSSDLKNGVEADLANHLRSDSEHVLKEEPSIGQLINTVVETVPVSEESHHIQKDQFTDGNDGNENNEVEQRSLSNNAPSEERRYIHTWNVTEEGIDVGSAYAEEAYLENYDYRDDQEQFEQNSNNPEPQHRSNADGKSPNISALDSRGLEDVHAEVQGTDAEYEEIEYGEYSEDYNGEYSGQYQGDYEESYQGEYEEREEEHQPEEFHGAQIQNDGNGINEQRQSILSDASPNGKRLRDGDDTDSLDVQHIKRSRSQ